MWSNFVLGLWLMVSPFVFALLNQRVFRVLWEDFILGFGIAAFSLCRLVSRRRDQIVLCDWLVTALGVITLLNPLLYSYYNVKVGVWNNLAVGAAVFLLALYQDWKDSDGSPWLNGHHGAH
jgi:putative effector of murein hydrolase